MLQGMQPGRWVKWAKQQLPAAIHGSLPVRQARWISENLSTSFQAVLFHYVPVALRSHLGQYGLVTSTNAGCNFAPFCAPAAGSNAEFKQAAAESWALLRWFLTLYNTKDFPVVFLAAMTSARALAIQAHLQNVALAISAEDFFDCFPANELDSLRAGSLSCVLFLSLLTTIYEEFIARASVLVRGTLRVFLPRVYFRKFSETILLA